MNSDLEELIKKYVVCRENCALLIIESLAMNGFVKKIRVEDCERKNFKRIVAELLNNQVVVSECRFREEIEHSVRIMNIYIELSERYISRTGLKIVESKQREE